ncbi:GNAT family N-acetyltransferase [Terracoccus sp. 273MFTsu3.1]|uniref:GNAT family N-acetyltransferase n=1 Tax=Terracoccus sp. 273MFTsu3.1 TaxID=1172188 RepID=UPI0012DE80D2|nr:GNAT family N-acetyltransferase [Terracoccus sp. 273MFTsu3.1]
MTILRMMTAADVPGVVAVQEPGAVLGLADVFPQDQHPFPREAIADRWLRELDLLGTDCFVVLHGDAVAGFAAIRGDEFLHFGIAVEHWGTGLAALAHDDVLDRLRERGITRARLRVFTGNGRGRRFYEKHGWQPTGERSRSSFLPCPELLGYARRL